MPSKDSGLYILVTRLKKGRHLRIGVRSPFPFRAGTYLYIGRALRGLTKRLARHRRARKKLHWHIDYFLREAEIIAIWVKACARDECRTARAVRAARPGALLAQKRFGSSDCRCPGHLLYLPDPGDLEPLRARLGFVREGGP